MNDRIKCNSLKIILLASLCFSASARDRVHFYSTIPIWQEPRFEKDWLFSFDLNFYEGSTWKGRNSDHCFCPLLDIYGKHNMHLLGQNVPGKDLSKHTDATLTLLSLIPARGDFAKLSFDGHFNGKQSEITITQNFKKGFFALIHLPIRSLEINCISYTDLSPKGPEIPNKNNPIWKSFLTQFETILNQYNLDIGSFSKTHVGDLSIMAGWTRNNEDTKIFDFLDTTIEVGALFPTGAKRDPDKVFSLPTGYDGHIGLPLSFDFALGLYEWLTIGGHFDSLFLFEKTKCMRMKTDEEQSGFIKLAKGQAVVSPGVVVHVGAYLKADHFVGGLSFILGYGYSFKGNDSIDTCNNAAFDTFIASDDEMFQEWKMHTIHLGADYDFTKENWKFGPRVGVFYNWYVSGKRTFKTNTAGMSFGLDIIMDF